MHNNQTSNSAFLRTYPHHEATPGSSGKLSAEGLPGARHCPGHQSPLHISIESPEAAPHIQVSSLIPSPWHLCSEVRGRCLLLTEMAQSSCLPHLLGHHQVQLPCPHSVRLLSLGPRYTSPQAQVRHVEKEGKRSTAASVVIGEATHAAVGLSVCSLVCLVVSGWSHQHQVQSQPFSLPGEGRLSPPSGLMQSATEAHPGGGGLGLRAHASATTELSFPFVSHPHSREDRTDPRKPLLCEVWVPDARAAQPGGPCVG